MSGEYPEGETTHFDHARIIPHQHVQRAFRSIRQLGGGRRLLVEVDHPCQQAHAVRARGKLSYPKILVLEARFPSMRCGVQECFDFGGGKCCTVFIWSSHGWLWSGWRRREERLDGWTLGRHY